MTFQTMQYNFEIVEGHIVRIRHLLPNANEEIWNIYLENVFWGGRIAFPMSVESEAIDRILWLYDLKNEEFEQTGEFHAKGPSTGVICVYTNKKENEMYFIMFTNRQQMYRRFIHFWHKKEHAILKKGFLEIGFAGCLQSDKAQDFQIENVKLVVDANHTYDIKQPLTKRKSYYYTKIETQLDSIVSQETQINNPIHIEVEVGGQILDYNIGHKSKRKRPSKFYYVPVSYQYYKDKALFIRKNIHQNYTLVVREKESVECEEAFLKYESKWNSFYMYYLGKIKRFFHKVPVNLYFEKNSMKAEEGTFEIFNASLKSDNSKNYFILDKNSPQWEQLSKHANVVQRYSKQYYKLLYSADCFISTETSSHLNVHRAINKYVRKTLLEKSLIFLQHGVTYLKCQGEGSVFGKGKEGEPTYMIVGSDKEADAVAGMLHIPKERCVITGLPVFSTIEYQHINEKSDDIVTIMMTWKPSEEHMLSHFKDSGYYRNVCAIYEMIKKYIPSQHINIVPHPKVVGLLMQTDLKDVIWNKPVSDALKITKLLITDYSSVCYNAFYQGAAVIFYQPDLEEYQREVGKLVPKDEEYIGYRFFDLNDLEECIRKGICRGYMNLEILRSIEFVNRYLTINQFTDGKNIERIVDFLSSKKII